MHMNVYITPCNILVLENYSSHMHTCVYIIVTALTVFTLHNLFVAPSQPQQLQLCFVTSTSVTLQWKPPKYPNGVVTKYSVHCDGKSIGDYESDKMMATIVGLSSDTVYVLEVKAYTQVGAGAPVSLVVTTSKLLYTCSGTV